MFQNWIPQKNVEKVKIPILDRVFLIGSTSHTPQDTNIAMGHPLSFPMP